MGLVDFSVQICQLVLLNVHFPLHKSLFNIATLLESIATVSAESSVPALMNGRLQKTLNGNTIYTKTGPCLCK